MSTLYLHKSTIVVLAIGTALLTSPPSSGIASSPPKQMILILGDEWMTTEVWYIRPFRVSGSITCNTHLHVYACIMYMCMLDAKRYAVYNSPRGRGCGIQWGLRMPYHSPRTLFWVVAWDYHTPSNYLNILMARTASLGKIISFLIHRTSWILSFSPILINQIVTGYGMAGARDNSSTFIKECGYCILDII